VLKGQWIGRYTGNVDGKVIINIDEVDDHFGATAFLYPDDRTIPSSAAYIVTENKSNKHLTKAIVNAINPQTGFQCDWEDIKRFYPDYVIFGKEANLEIDLVDDLLNINSISDNVVQFKCSIKKPVYSECSKIIAEELTWNEYKSKLVNLLGKSYLFRGQKKSWSLRTSFHRKGRYRIDEFINNDVRLLHQRICALTPHYFNLSDPLHNGAFFNLLQHHGYPTPMLDWTFSPYVAAFFAFRKYPKNYNGDDLVRIFIFNNELWKKSYPQIDNLNPSYPHLSVADFIALNNPRMIPQQAVTTATNLDDIEAYIQEKESQSGKKFIEAIDIPARFRNEVMQELSFMGITAGTMFPGIDGVCEELREKLFD
jgi:hypothetical protein